MQIDYALILSAGMGTRMGEIGKKFPKALWPVFNKSLLELQLDFCNDLGIKKVFVNTHFLAEDIERYVQSDSKFSNVIVLHEDPLLDSGGAIHNMASRGDVNYTGNVLLVNADQFLFFDKNYYQEALSHLENSRAALFGITVDKGAKYNETILEDSKLVEIKKPSGEREYVTYSGLGLLKLDGLLPVPGVTKFFETVVNYKKEAVKMIVPSKFEYWDFGTAEIYFNSIKKIYQNVKDNNLNGWLMSFLRTHVAINGNEDSFYSFELNSISMDGVSEFERDSIVGKGIIQKI